MATLTSCLIYVITLFLTVLIEGVESETCPVHTNGILTGYQSCGNGCCGRYPNYYCCDLSTAAVAGIVLGGIVVVCLLVFICAHCLKKKNHAGTIVRPVQPTTSNTIVFTGSSGRYPAYSHMAMPPPYKRFDSPPPYAEQPGRNTAAPPPGMPGTTQNQYGNPPGTQPGPHAYPYGMRPMGNETANPPPPEYSSSAAPSAILPASSAPPPRQYGYGQNHGWSESSGGGPPNSLAASSGETAASSSSSSPSAAAAVTSSLGPNQNGISPNRNTITTRNFPSRLPPLPND